jgi:hypothetical protein
MISSTAPASGVPSTTISKQNRTESTTTPDSFPISSRTYTTRAPSVRAMIASTADWVSDNSCIGSADPGQRVADQQVADPGSAERGVEQYQSGRVGLDPRPLLVKSTEDRLDAPDCATPGRTTFRSETTAVGQGWIGLARIEPGVDWAAFRGRLAATLSDDQERIVKGMAALDGSASLVGGAVIHPGMSAEFTVDLSPGPHVLFDYLSTAGDGDRPRYRLLHVDGEAEDANEVVPAATIRAVLTDAGPRLEVLGTPTAGRPLAFENAMPRPYVTEAVMFPVAADVTDATVAHYAALFVDGSSDWPPDPPFDPGAGTGCLPLSAGRASVVALTAPSGRYVVADWLKDPADGVRLVKRGHHRIVELS